jgi:cyclin B
MKNSEEDFKCSLKNHLVKEGLRAKMIDWILEVYGTYSTTTSHETYFRAANLIDLYLKKTWKRHVDADLHLIGVACMFIATKIEDVYHIPLSDFIKRVAHNKFTEKDLKEKEMEILQILNYQVYFPTLLNSLSMIYFKSFNLNDK